MKIALFAYNFPHKKTQDFIFRLLAEGLKIEVIYAADPVKLNIPPSGIKTKINHLGLLHPRKIAENLGIDYMVVNHDSAELCEDSRNRKINLGIIAGARILKEHIIDSFSLGIINFHPGVIPYARGLDALLWSVYYKHPLGVTAHLVDKRVDAGRIIEIQEISIYKKDTLLDLSERLYEIQLDMLLSSVQKVAENKTYELADYGSYNRKMPLEEERVTLTLLSDYLEKYGK